MSNGEIHEISSKIGELVSDVRNLVQSTAAMHRRLDEHVQKDAEAYGVLKAAVEKIAAVDEAQRATAKKVSEHETLKNKMVGYGIGAGAGTGGIVAWVANFLNKAG